MKEKFNEYQMIATRTLNETIRKSRRERVKYICLGLLEETGEVVAEIRKAYYKGNFHEKTLDKNSIKKELGDVLWYLALVCNDQGLKLGEKYQVDRKKMAVEKSRENTIEVALELGQQNGKLVEMIRSGQKSKEIHKEIGIQIENMEDLANILQISMEDIMEENIKKVTKRYEDTKER
ncbi:MAG: hypothetical protein HFJ37_03415 [Clostridia bacterium]|nr:hypothetical protein [Clostridia bacterium]